jgi:hypothetical protein
MNNKTWILQSKYDDNETLEIRDELYESALARALDMLGFNLLLLEEDKDDD